MNKVFRVIWSEAVQAWIAVSELSKSHQKSRSVALGRLQSAADFSAKFFKLSLLSLAMLSAGVSGGTFAADTDVATQGDLQTLKNEMETKVNDVESKLVSIQPLDPVTELDGGILFSSPEGATLKANVESAGEALIKARQELYVKQFVDKLNENKLKPYQDSVSTAEANYTNAVEAVRTWAQSYSKVVLSTADTLRLLEGQRTKYVSINGDSINTNYFNEGAKDKDSIAIGGGARVFTSDTSTHTGSIAIGTDATIHNATNSIAIGSNTLIEPGMYLEKGQYNTRESQILPKSKQYASFSLPVKNNIVIGNGAKAQYASESIVIGSEAGQGYSIDTDKFKYDKETKTFDVGNIRGAEKSIVIGARANTDGEESIRIGYQSGMKSKNGVNFAKLGTSITSTKGTILIGASTSLAAPVSDFPIGSLIGYSLDDSIAIGNKAKINSNTNGSIALGGSSVAGGVGPSSNSIAIGWHAKAYVSDVRRKDLSDPDDEEVVYDNRQPGAIAIGTYAQAGRNFSKEKSGATAKDQIDDLTLKRAYHVVEDKIGDKRRWVDQHSGGAVAIGNHSKSIGDASIAIGEQSIAGPSAVVIGGKPTTIIGDIRFTTYLEAVLEKGEEHSINATTDYLAHNRVVERTNFSELLSSLSTDTALNAEVSQPTFGGRGSVVLGVNASASSLWSVGIGYLSRIQVGAVGGVSIGALSAIGPNGVGNVAIGTGSRAVGTFATAVGSKSIAFDGGVAIGQGSRTREESVAIGFFAENQNIGGTAIGYYARVSGKEGAVSIGYKTAAAGDSSIVLGGASTKEVSKHEIDYTDGDDPAAIYDEKTGVIKPVLKHKTLNEYFKYISGRERGLEPDFDIVYMNREFPASENGSKTATHQEQYRVGEGSVTIGVKSVAQGDLSMALGTSAWSKGLSSVAVGTGAEATQQNSVAIGAGSTTENYAGTHQPSVLIDGALYKWAGGDRTDPGDVVSFGSKGYERQLKNVAAGEVSPVSTDAVNGSQLFAFGRKISNLTSGGSGPVVYTDESNVRLISYTDDFNNINGKYYAPSAFDDRGILKAYDKKTKEELVAIPTKNPETKKVEIKYYHKDDVNLSDNTPKFKKDEKGNTLLNDKKEPVIVEAVAVDQFEFHKDSTPTRLAVVNFTKEENSQDNGKKYGTTTSINISNVASNLPTTANVALKGADNQSIPITTYQAAPDTATRLAKFNLDKDNKEILNPDYIGDNAATVLDVLNSGWNLQNNGSAVDFVKAYDVVDFANGDGTTAVVTSEGAKSKVLYNINRGVLSVKPDSTGENPIAGGGIIGPLEKAKTELDKAMNAYNKAQSDYDKALEDDKVSEADKKRLEDKLAKAVVDRNAAQSAVDNASKSFATAENIAEVLNQTHWNLIAGATGSGVVTGNQTAAVSAGDVVTLQAGNGVSLTQNGTTFTFAVDGQKAVESAHVPVVYTDSQGNKLTKIGNQFYLSNDLGNAVKIGDKYYAVGSKLDEKTNKVVTADGKTEAKEIAALENKDIAVSVQNPNGSTTEATVLTNLTSGLAKYSDEPKDVNGKAESKAGLVMLDNNNVKDHTAATIGDLRAMGWVIEAEKETGSDNAYSDQVRNAHKVSFKGKNGIEVTGKTNGDTREITISIKEGEVEKDNSNFVTGDKVADALAESGWTVGKASAEDLAKAQDLGEEKINPNDKVLFADGKHTKVRVGTFDVTDNKGVVTTTTVIATDVNLPVSEIQPRLTRDGQGNTVAMNATDGKWYKADIGGDGTLKIRENSSALSDEEATKITTDNVMRLDPDHIGEAYAAASTRQGLTPSQLGELVGKQTVAAERAAENVANLLKGQPDVVINAAKAAARKAAEDEVKVQYLKDNHLDQGSGGTVITNVAWGKAPSDAVNVDQLQNSGFKVDSHVVANSNGKVISGNETATKVKMDDTLNLDAGNNVEITRNGRDIAVAVSRTPTFDSVKVGEGEETVTVKNTEGALDVGSARITNVAAGRIAADSTDAVNGSQLFALTGFSENTTIDSKYTNNADKSINIAKGENKQIDKTATVMTDKDGNPYMRTYNVADKREIITNNVYEAIQNINEQGIKFFHSNDGKKREKWEDSNAFDSSASGKYATAIGAKSSSEGENAIAMGYGAQALRENSVAIGTGNVVNAAKSGALGDPNYISEEAAGSYAFGNDNRITSENTFVLGNGVNALHDAKGNVEMETVKLKAKDGKTRDETVPKALNKAGTVKNSVYLGNRSTVTAGDEKAQSQASYHNLTKEGYAGITTSGGAVGLVSTATVGDLKYGGFAGAMSKGAVSVGAAGDERRIQNVAAGEVSATSTDAINGSQLHAATHRLYNHFESRINRVGRRADAGTASALAASQLAQASHSGKSMVSVAAGSYQGQNALALGLSRVSDNGKITVRFAGTTNSQGKTGVAASLGYEW